MNTKVIFILLSFIPFLKSEVCDAKYCYRTCQNTACSNCCAFSIFSSSSSPFDCAPLTIKCTDELPTINTTTNSTSNSTTNSTSNTTNNTEKNTNTVQIGISDEELIALMVNHFGMPYFGLNKAIILPLQAAGAALAGLFFIILIFQIYWKCFRFKNKIRADSFESNQPFGNSNPDRRFRPEPDRRFRPDPGFDGKPVLENLA